MICVIDSGLSNVGSILNMLKRIGADSRSSRDPAEVAEADKIILPGVGAFDTGMKRLAELDLIDVLNRKALEEKVPTLGICLGMQFFTQRSEEGELPGLGWLDAETVRFDFPPEAAGLRTPHMGWDLVDSPDDTGFFEEIEGEVRFYFIHSYHVVCRQPEDVFATTRYGYPFTSAFRRDNLLGVQFHPEKSHRYGMSFFRRFAEL